MTQAARPSRSKAVPLVSVVVPAWNAETTLGRTLASVAAQTYPRLEIIIVDDGSTDATAAVAEEFCASEPRATLIRQANGGVASARNRGIRESNGEWIAPLDADDLWHPTKIEKQVAAALAAPQPPGFVYCWRRLIDRDDRVFASGLRLAFEGSAFMRLGYANAVECGSSLLMSRQAALAAGGYDESLRARHAQGCEDMLLQLKLASRFPVAVVREHLVGWRSHHRNMSSDFDQMARSFNLVFDDLAAAGTPVPRRVTRRALARIVLELGEQRAVEGRAAASAWLVARSLALDPGASARRLAYRALRSVMRRFTRGGTTLNFPCFDEVDPAAELPSHAVELRRLSRISEQFEKRRLSRLAAEEPALPSRAAAPVCASTRPLQ